MAEFKPCPFCGRTPELVTCDVEPQGDPWYSKKVETFVSCDCGCCLFDGAFHEGFYDAETRAAAAWNARAERAEAAQPSERAQLLVLARIREAVGDPHGRLMHDELVERIRGLRAATIAEAAAICDRREARAKTKSAQACYRLCAADILALGPGLPAEAEQRVPQEWISVEDRLPEPPWEDVLVHPRPTDYCCEAHIDGNGKWAYGEYEHNFGHVNHPCAVTHWRPHPAAPKAEEAP